MMRLNQQLKLRQVGSSFFIVDSGEVNVDLSYILTLNRPAAFLWECFCDRPFTVDMMVDSLCEHFDVARDVARHDIEKMLEQWKDYGMMG